MTSGLGSISITGSALLGGTASKIDTDALINALMSAKSIPQKQLQLQVQNQAKTISAYQGINSTMAGITSAASSLMDTTGWSATKATSSSASVVASSTSTAPMGTSTFDVTALATAQVSTVAADASGNVIDFSTNPTLTLTVAGTDHVISLTSGSATDVAKAVNDANVGVRAAVINVDNPAMPGSTMQVLQLSSAKTGAANTFGSAQLPSMSTLVAAQDAQITVGNPAAGGYTISSATNTFTDAMPGVTFTVSKLETGVTVSVASDTAKVANLVQSLVSAVNSAKLGIGTYTGKGAQLQGDSMVTSLNQDMSYVFSSATATGKSLSEYGIELTKEGVVSFDASVFTTAYNADPAGTMQTISDAVGTPLKAIADAASAPITGTLTQAITSLNNRNADLNTQIATWSDRLDNERTQLTLKYTAMQTALAKLQSQGDWLTSMFKSMDSSSQKSS